MKFFQSLRGIKKKIIFMTFFSFILIITIYSTFYIRDTINLVRENNKKTSEIVRYVILKEAERFLLTRDSTDIFSLIRNIISNEPSLISIVVTDPQDNELIRIFRPGYEKKKKLNVFYPVFSSEEGIFEPTLIGKLNIYVSAEREKEYQNKAFVLSFVLGTLVLTFGIAFSIFVTNIFFTRMKGIKKGLIEIAEGKADLTKRISLNENEDIEFKEIAESFNEFVESLSERIKST
ncbi:MAG: hypothetical protein ABDH37_05840, partial [Candidatus Hydrothermales bacterium]